MKFAIVVVLLVGSLMAQKPESIAATSKSSTVLKAGDETTHYNIRVTFKNAVRLGSLTCTYDLTSEIEADQSRSLQFQSNVNGSADVGSEPRKEYVCVAKANARARTGQYKLTAISITVDGQDFPYIENELPKGLGFSVKNPAKNAARPELESVKAE